MQKVTDSDILAGFKKLKIVDKRVVIHSSLSSFGYVEGGAETVLKVALENFKTILMPAFCWESNTAPPVDDHPDQNGCDYSFYNNWNKPQVPFIVEKAGIEKSMGIISRRFISMRDISRSEHAWHSWASFGDSAKELTQDHYWQTTNLPLERMINMESYILLLGVGLKSCTAIHIAEERLGRRPFIRWAVDRNGQVRRVRAAGCSLGFDKLMPYCNSLFREAYVGNCRMLVAPLDRFINHTTSVISSDPELTRCSNSCLRCHDAILGGPKE